MLQVEMFVDENVSHLQLGQTQQNRCVIGKSYRACAGDRKSLRTHTREAAWTLEPHVCRHCFGRLASKPTGRGRREYRCTNCGAGGEGHDSHAHCACGLTVKRMGIETDAGLRCQANPSPSPEFPSLFVAAEVDTLRPVK